jgi:hypothetical protein
MKSCHGLRATEILSNAALHMRTDIYPNYIRGAATALVKPYFATA